MNPDEAAQALEEIGHRQEQVISANIVPDWFWWTVSALMVGFSIAVDTRRPIVVGIGTALFTLAMLGVSGRIAYRALRHAQVRNDLLRPVGVLAILGLVALTLGTSLPVAFGLQAAGVAHPAVWGILVGAVIMAIGGPWLTRFLHRTMLANRIGTRRS